MNSENWIRWNHFCIQSFLLKTPRTSLKTGWVVLMSQPCCPWKTWTNEIRSNIRNKCHFDCKAEEIHFVTFSLHKVVCEITTVSTGDRLCRKSSSVWTAKKTLSVLFVFDPTNSDENSFNFVCIRSNKPGHAWLCYFLWPP